ncbi:glutaredoxin family protein [Bacillus salitolerans]|uniref:Glutaredoxin family protein n=1 Tax=Bacillus salitolerans TaxID=1437434 RepID=A0ABW4LK50_9BACI
MSYNVIIYTQETCPPCHEEKLWFKEHGIQYEERDIRKNPEYLDEVIQLGAAATPVTVVKSEIGEEVIYGFDYEKLSKLLQT